jgi:hypothetical protein
MLLLLYVLLFRCLCASTEDALTVVAMLSVESLWHTPSAPKSKTGTIIVTLNAFQIISCITEFNTLLRCINRVVARTSISVTAAALHTCLHYYAYCSLQQ